MVNGKTYTPDYSVDTHGSHVAGIIGAKYIDENNPHGVAYDAKLYGVQIFGNNKSSGAKFDTPNVYNYFKDKDVKIINNSWNSTLYPVVSMVEPGRYSLTLKNYSSTQLLQQIHSNQTAKELNDLARRKKLSVVFAAGNEGIISPGHYGFKPSL